MIRDQVVFGTNNSKLWEKMLKEKDITLLKAEQIYKAAEVSAQQNEVWAQAEKQMALVKKKQQYKCAKCNRPLEPGRCPAFGRSCFLCTGTDHFAACCKKGPQVKVHLKIDSVGNHADWIIHAKVADQPVVLKVDTGSQANLLPYSIYRRCTEKANLKPSASVLRSYSGDAIKHIGVATLRVVIYNRSGDIEFFIVKKGSQALLGLLASEALGLVSRSVSVVNTSNIEKIVTEFRPLFQGTGCLARQYRMVLRDDATPVVQPARRVPLALREPLREELERMERADIIRKVNGPT
ncbi:uncharacterized protein LOC121045893, partial [Ixodes scapularis]|uniref:uncharacterized protein LOC121045893 n=1 Tax=Ixodes scapularis TaxID=6945 RepID=UPI001C384854